MSVVGFDLGAYQSVIAAARNRGIDIITNEVSSRFTPSLVSFGNEKRHIGESAASAQISNLKNTIAAPSLLQSRPYDEKLDGSNPALFALPNGDVGVRVNYLGNQTEFRPVQLVAMYLGHLKETAEKGLGLPVTDCVISVPVWMGDRMRRGVLDAAKIVGLNVLRLINNTTAAALAYGITKTDLPEPSKPRRVCFVDWGYSSTTVAITDVARGQLNVKGVAFDPEAGGKILDDALVQYFVQDIKEKYSMDVTTNGKATHRLKSACEKAKKVLSANLQAPINIECIMDDRDVRGMIKREEFEAMISEGVQRVVKTIELALQRSGVPKDQIDVVETIGGSTRVPCVRSTIASFFGRDILTSTLNPDEGIARGCALQAAIASPAFRVRDFAVNDLASYPISLRWTPCGVDAENHMQVVSARQALGKLVGITLSRNDEVFEAEAYYEDGYMPPMSQSVIARAVVSKVPKTSNGNEPSKVRLQLRLTVDGTFEFAKADVAIEEAPKEDVVMMSAEEACPPKDVEMKEAGEAKPSDTGDQSEPRKDGEALKADASGAPSAPPKAKKKIVKVPVGLTSTTPSLSEQELADGRAQEARMASADRTVVETQQARNHLEEYIYDARSKVQGPWQAYFNPSDVEPFQKRLDELEEWLYTDEGEAATKATYEARLAELLKVGRPVRERFEEAERLPVASVRFSRILEEFAKRAKTGGDALSHIPASDLLAIETKAKEQYAWLSDVLERQRQHPKYQSPVVTTFQLDKAAEDFGTFASEILNRPKPKPEEAKDKKDTADQATPGGSGDTTPSEGSVENAKGGVNGTRGKGDGGEVVMEDLQQQGADVEQKQAQKQQDRAGAEAGVNMEVD